MTIETLGLIASTLEKAGIEYEFMNWEPNPLPDPYFVGEYTETEPYTESGEQESTFILTGTSRQWGTLEKAKEEIKKLFPKVTGLTAVLEHSSAAVYYATAFPVPTDDAVLKRLQINLTVKEWSDV